MIRDNIFKVKERISRVCASVGRDPAEITLVAVTKGRTADEVRQALACGITHIGENRIQEALVKFSLLATSDQRPAAVHMIGHLQSNKAKDAVRMFDLIQSVDSVQLAREIDKHAAKINKLQDVLVEIKTSEEATKYGISLGSAVEEITRISGLKNIRIQGLMTIAPQVDTPEKARPYFRQLRELSDSMRQRPAPPQAGLPSAGTSDQRPTLSMGMSDDFEIAIEEGATMVRLGRAIFDY